MAVGFPAKTNFATGEVLTATNMNDITGTLNLLQSTLYPAGRNKIINGNFGVWQRGTSFSNPAFGAYAADRWFLSHDGTGVTRTISQQTFTPGTAPVAGYEGTYFLRYAVSVAGTGNTANNLMQKIEDVRTFAGQTVTVSFWAKAAAAATYSAGNVAQDFGSGGSATVYTVPSPATFNFTTSWARYSYTVNVPSIAGKTIGTNSHLDVTISGLTNTTFTLDVWGVQIEAGSTASPFQTASGSVGGELALCQRYYQKYSGDTIAIFNGTYYSTTAFYGVFSYPVMRVAPTTSTAATSFNVFSNGANKINSAHLLAQIGTSQLEIQLTTAAATAGDGGWARFNTGGQIELSAEL
jgi:hypothetical protein